MATRQVACLSQRYYVSILPSRVPYPFSNIFLRGRTPNVQPRPVASAAEQYGKNKNADSEKKVFVYNSGTNVINFFDRLNWKALAKKEITDEGRIGTSPEGTAEVSRARIAECRSQQDQSRRDN